MTVLVKTQYFSGYELKCKCGCGLLNYDNISKMIIYVRMQIKEHVENCPVRDLVDFMKERQNKIDEKLDKLLFLMVKKQ